MKPAGQIRLSAWHLNKQKSTKKKSLERKIRLNYFIFFQRDRGNGDFMSKQNPPKINFELT